MIAVLTVVLFLLLSAALGRRILLTFSFRFERRLEELCYAAGLGFGVIAIIVMIGGLTDAFRNPISNAAMAVVGCLLIPDMLLILRMPFEAIRDPERPRWTVVQWAFFAVISVAVLCLIIAALAPPTAWDAMTAHLTYPMLWLEHGGIFRLNDLHSANPHNGTMLFVPLYAFGGEHAPALLHLSQMLMVGLLLYSICRVHLPRTSSMVALGTFLLMPLTSALAHEALVDFVLVLFMMLSFGSFLRWWEGERAKWIILSGIFAGLAIGTKYNALPLMILLPVGVLVKVIWARHDRFAFFRSGVIAVILAAGVGCPWYVRNIVIVGNPIYPLMAKYIPTRHITAAKTGEAPAYVVPGKYPRDLMNMLLFPVNYTFAKTQGFLKPPTAEGVDQSPGPLFLALVPLLFFFRPVPPWLRVTLALFLIGMVLLVPMGPLPRYMMPYFVPMAMVVGFVYRRLSVRRWSRILFGVVVLSVFALQLVPFVARAGNRFGVVLGYESRDAYLNRVDDVYPIVCTAEKVLPHNAKIALFEERVYYFDKAGLNVTMVMPYWQDVVDFPMLPYPMELMARIRELGFTHVIVDQPLLRQRVREASDELSVLYDHGLKEIAREKGMVLYEVMPPEKNPLLQMPPMMPSSNDTSMQSRTSGIRPTAMIRLPR